ncbi:MAG: hypothetical protein ACE369_00735 [Roseovarius sp.]
MDEQSLGQDGRCSAGKATAISARGANSYDRSTDLQEWFAPAEYLKVKDNETLKAPAFEM